MYLDTQTRRKHLKEYLIKNQLEHSLVHINYGKICDDLNMVRPTLSNDIKHLLATNFLESFCLDGSIYRIK